MDNPLGDAFVIEVGDLLAKDEVLEQRRAAQARLQRVLVVGDRHALVGRERAVGRIDAHAIERADGRVLADVRPTAADLVGAVQLGDGAGPDDRIGRSPRVSPAAGLMAASASCHSRGLLALKGTRDASSFVPVSLVSRSSAVGEEDAAAGPPTVDRLLRQRREISAHRGEGFWLWALDGRRCREVAGEAGCAESATANHRITR